MTGRPARRSASRRMRDQNVASALREEPAWAQNRTMRPRPGCHDWVEWCAAPGRAGPTGPASRRRRRHMQNRQSHAHALAVMAGAALFTAAMLARPVLAVEDSGQRFPPPTTTADPKGQKGQKQQGQKKKKQNQSELRE